MTDRQLRKLANQLRAGYEGYTTLLLAVEKTHVGDQPSLERGIEMMRRVRQELLDQSCLAAEPPRWLREVTL